MTLVQEVSVEYKKPKHPDDFGYTEEGYEEWMRKNNNNYMPSSDSVDYIKRKTEELISKHKEHVDGWMEAHGHRKYLRPYLNDSIVVDVIERIKTRADKGMQKYGVAMTRNDVSTIEWLRHAQEEALDLAVYLERCIRDLEDLNRVPEALRV